MTTVSDITVDDVEFSDNKVGLEVHHSTVTNLEVKDCTFQDNTNYGIRIDSAGVVNGLTVKDSYFDNQKWAGIGSYGYIDGLIIRGCTFINHYFCGIMLGAEFYPHSPVNHYYRNVDIQTSTFENNDIGIDVYVYGSTEHEISDIQLHYCSFIDNEGYGVCFYDFGMKGAYEDVKIDATLNWWGDAHGPSRSMGKAKGHEEVKGDRVSSNVKFAPWLQEEP